MNGAITPVYSINALVLKLLSNRCLLLQAILSPLGSAMLVTVRAPLQKHSFHHASHMMISHWIVEESVTFDLHSHSPSAEESRCDWFVPRSHSCSLLMSTCCLFLGLVCFSFSLKSSYHHSCHTE